MRAFLGDYRVTVTRGGRTKTVPASVTKNRNGVTIVKVRMPYSAMTLYVGYVPVYLHGISLASLTIRPAVTLRR